MYHGAVFGTVYCFWKLQILSCPWSNYFGKWYYSLLKLGKWQTTAKSGINLLKWGPFAPFIHEYSWIMGKPKMFSFLTNVKQKFRTMEFLVGGYLKHEQTFILNISLAKLDVDIMDIIWTKVGHAILSLDPNNL